jgi:hypothetical protein
MRILEMVNVYEEDHNNIHHLHQETKLLPITQHLKLHAANFTPHNSYRKHKTQPTLYIPSPFSCTHTIS